MIPTIVNTIAVLTGASIGLLFHHRLSDRFRTILFQAIGLATIAIGLKDTLKTEDIPILALSMIVGALIGEWLNIEAFLESLGATLKRWSGRESDSQFIDGFVFSSILFCAGALTVVGTFEAGVQGIGDKIYVKSILDGHASIFLAGAMGAGVMASAATVLVFQSALTLLFMFWGMGLPEYVITEVAAVGGLLIIGISINLMELGHVRVGNLLPGMFFAGLFVWIKHLIIG